MYIYIYAILLFTSVLGIPSWSDELARMQKKFSDSLMSISPDFQDVRGYDKDKPGTANLSIASNSIAEKYKCLSITLEMPFKDTKKTAMPLIGWTPIRSEIFGSHMVDAITKMIPDINKTKKSKL